MRKFRFRAAAALELRRKAEDRARELLAAATAASDAAQARATAATSAAAAAGDAFVDRQRGGVDRTQMDWHRTWIARLQIEADVSRRRAAVSAATAERAAASVATAYLRRRALERLRDRAWNRHQREVLQDEMREMNELAAVRFAVQAADTGGSEPDD
jgi:flagellar export protein FliJ